ncbi:arginine--tRNA ligase [Aureispira anguillae]|uniref:Arginine--tRNA ligase n=1 Tax=Aureispira anguillae TaxID=2864201 RepID=A0A915YHA4_9BACT|nr:arginine--tRNA ligase [Aureispira anguillae]BDS13153.1 arginine--tRNA ligase [Aureispira anguillae]
MNIENIIKENVCEAIETLYDKKIETKQVQIKQIPKHLEGDYSVITFPFAKLLGKKPNEIAADMAGQLMLQTDILANAVSAGPGFCNLSIGDAYWTNFVKEVLAAESYGQQAANGQTVLVEYSSPNTNKPLHLGHIRNNLLGYATAEILKAAGYDVKKVQIINDRGVHICKSMLAWQKWGNGETPASTGKKGDHLVGHYYVEFEKHFQAEYKVWQETEEGQKAIAHAKTKLAKNRFINKKQLKGIDDETEREKIAESMFEEGFKKYIKGDFCKTVYFNQYSVLGQATKEMLQKWEANDEEVRALWNEMNGWVYDGFKETYEKLGVDFDQLYYESKTYLAGKQLVLDELATEKSIFFKKDDGSTWIDLTDAKLDEKVVLRSDGTSMYITQDLGTASLRFKDFGMDKMVYVVGNEQDYHFKVLFETLKRLGHSFAKNCHHLSYGMVNLTTGRMKSREGTVVDADHLMADVVANVKAESESREKLGDLAETEKIKIWEAVALGALKFYILKVEPKKTMVFDPKQSIDLQGQTGPYIQNAHVRTQSVQRMVVEKGIELVDYSSYQLSDVERDILVLVHELPSTIQKAAQNYNPADIANYMYELAKEFHKFWGHTTILDADNPAATSFRLDMSKAVATALKAAGKLIGMQMPDRM